jgi:hypothetical protein
MRFAILGLYNSGSTTLAGMLHRLGANMGPPFWANDDEGSEHNFYEPYDLSSHLRRWWDEPHIIERTPAEERTAFLRHWVQRQECVGPAPVGAKHPLLSLCARDLMAGWGADTRLIWSYRDLEASVRGLERRGWFRGLESAAQQRLWDGLHEFELSNGNIVRVSWDDVRSDPPGAARCLSSLVGLAPTESQLTAAIAFVRT